MKFLERFFYKLKINLIKKKYKLSEVELGEKVCENCKFCTTLGFSEFCEKGNGQIEKTYSTVCDLFKYKKLDKILNSIKTNLREVNNETKN